MPLPNSGMSFTPFDPLAASELNDIVENVEALAAGTGLNNDSIGTTQLAPALSNATPGVLSDLGTAYATGATLSVPAGTWFLIAKCYVDFLITLRVICTCEIYNSTDSAILDTTGAEAEFTSGTLNALVPATNAEMVTLADTKTIIARYKVSDATGTTDIKGIKLFAIPVGS